MAVETAGTWNQSAIELIQKIGRRITAAMEDTRETVFPFQRLSIVHQRGNVVALRKYFLNLELGTVFQREVPPIFGNNRIPF